MLPRMNEFKLKITYMLLTIRQRAEAHSETRHTSKMKFLQK